MLASHTHNSVLVVASTIYVLFRSIRHILYFIIYYGRIFKNHSAQLMGLKKEVVNFKFNKMKKCIIIINFKKI
jgi:hypothetical protein